MATNYAPLTKSPNEKIFDLDFHIGFLVRDEVPVLFFLYDFFLKKTKVMMPPLFSGHAVVIVS